MPGRTEDDLPIAADDPRFLTVEQKQALLAKQMATTRKLLDLGRQRMFYKLFPDETFEDPLTGQTYYARDLYPKHLEFFDAGRSYLERGFIAGNRIGKTVTGGYEGACHLTGEYPHWWTGHRFERPVRALFSGKTSETTRDIVQTKTLGPVEGSGPTKRLSGTGIIPGQRLGDTTWKNFPNLADSVKVRHVSGGWSVLWLKSYEQGRGIFEGTELDFIWFDEEPPIDVYGEALVRLMTTGGRMAMTFTPLDGWTETVEQFLGEPDLEGVPV